MFKQLVETVLKEYDRDDPHDNPWGFAKEFKQNQFEKEKLYSKPIQPVKPEDLVYIKVVNVQQFGSFRANEMYLTNKKEFPYTYYREKAYKFPVSKAEAFVEKHPKEIIDNMGEKYERHFEIEKI